MVARSRPSTRHPNLRGEPRSSESSPVTDVPVPPEPPGALRSKRTRISSISDSQRFNKRVKTDKTDALPKFKFPLRNRRMEDDPETKPVSVTKPVLLSSRLPNATPTLVRSHSNKPTKQSVTTKPPQKNVTTNQTEVAIPQQQEERRKLRSKDGGSRSKSELAMFFNNYEQMLSLEPPKPETLTPKTHITLIDDLPEASLGRPHLNPDYDTFGATKPLHNAQIIDLTSLETSPRSTSHDPLDAEIYFKAHRKSERAEKSARNSERERAQHEKVQLDRLLDGLKGPDWLKVMGITGVTESEKRLYEPKRALFTREVTALIKKFEDWKEEEKRQKERKKQEMREVEVQEVGDGGDAADDGEEAEEEEEEEEEEEDDDDNLQSPAPRSAALSLSNYDGAADYTSHEVDALAARQLHQETTFTASGPKKKTEPDASSATVLPSTLPPYTPFKSFYSKRHLRDAAVAGHRRSRTITAFGEPVPELDDHEFELPPTILTEDAVRASSRRKRRQRRGSSDG